MMKTEFSSSSSPKSIWNVSWLGLQILHTLGHSSPQRPMQGWPHSSFFWHLRLQGVLLHGSEHSLVHLECWHLFSHGSLHKKQTSPQTLGHAECLHLVTHFSLHGGQYWVHGSLHLWPHTRILLHFYVHLAWSPSFVHYPHLLGHGWPQTSIFSQFL